MVTAEPKIPPERLLDILVTLLAMHGRERFDLEPTHTTIKEDAVLFGYGFLLMEKLPDQLYYFKLTDHAIAFIQTMERGKDGKTSDSK